MIVKEKGALVSWVLHFCEGFKDSEMGLIEAFIKGRQLLLSVSKNALWTLKTNSIIKVPTVAKFEEGECIFFGAVYRCAKGQKSPLGQVYDLRK